MDDSPADGVLPLMLVALVVVARIALTRTTKKWTTLLRIGGVMVIGFGIGIALGEILGSDELAATFALMFFLYFGICVSYLEARRAKHARSRP